jgi:iron complex outermembrane receptor protein
VIVEETGETASPATLQRIGLAQVDRLDVPDVAATARLIPAAHTQTNSRGETLVYLRNAGERQVALFFDGALLNVPWDNRVDLSLVPAGVAGGLTVAKGVPSVLWGANVLGGAVNLSTRELERDGDYTEALGQGGTVGYGEGRALRLGRHGALAYAVAAGYARRDGLALPDDLEEATLRFSQPDDDPRTNTDLALAHGYGRLAYTFSPGLRLGLSVLHLDGEKGVAPEGHLDPAVENVRFWRYPLWRTTTAILNGEGAAGPVGLRGAVWASRFRQDIDAFTSDDYEELAEGQEDEDVTLGGRIVSEWPLRALTLRLALNGLTSTHRQQDFAVDSTGEPAFDPRLTYRQRLGSAGIEAEARPTDALTLTLGASLDAISTPETGDKPPRDGIADWGGTAGVLYALDNGWAVRGAVGRKTRFPTLRELFGEALRRFIPNPDLRPESAFLAEVAVEGRGTRVSGEVVGFLTRTDDTIDQITLDDGRRQRVNLGGSRVYGVELAGTTRLVQSVRLDGHLTVLRARATTEEGDETFLSEKPEAIGRLAATYAPATGPTATLEAVYLGTAYSPSGPDVFTALPEAFLLNARLGYRFAVGGLGLEAFARVDNLADAVVLPQLGLPGPGREVRGGLKLAF